MKTRSILLFPVGLAALAPPAPAGVAENFSGYPTGSTFSTGQTLGVAGAGWLDGWRTASSHVQTTVTIADTKPLDAGAYLDAVFASAAGQADLPSGAVSRPYEAPARPFTLSFRFRPTLVAPELRYFLFDNDARAAGPGNKASWQIVTAEGQWRLIDGGGNGTAETSIDTGLPVVAGVSYAFTLNVDPLTRTWSATLSDGQRTVTHERLNFRTDAFTTERWVHFGANETRSPVLGLAAGCAIDSLAIQP